MANSLLATVKQRQPAKSGQRPWHEHRTPQQQKQFFELVDYARKNRHSLPPLRQVCQEIGKQFNCTIAENTLRKYLEGAWA